jgi:hypothetical protein
MAPYPLLQVGMMLRGARVEDTLIGGPAFGRIFRGDDIIRVDGRRGNILNSIKFKSR